MKKRLATVILAMSVLSAVAPAQAHGWRGGCCGWGWGAPFVAGALVGASVYAATTPYYAYPYYGYPVAAPVMYSTPVPTTVVAAPPVGSAPSAPHTAYFCPTSKQFYPAVPTCTQTWQQVSVY